MNKYLEKVANVLKTFARAKDAAITKGPLVAGAAAVGASGYALERHLRKKHKAKQGAKHQDQEFQKWLSTGNNKQKFDEAKKKYD